jgi:hypothetical protein
MNSYWLAGSASHARTFVPLRRSHQQLTVLKESDLTLAASSICPPFAFVSAASWRFTSPSLAVRPPREGQRIKHTRKSKSH